MFGVLPNFFLSVATHGRCLDAPGASRRAPFGSASSAPVSATGILGDDSCFWVYFFQSWPFPEISVIDPYGSVWFRSLRDTSA